MNRKLWLEERQKGIGGSEAAAVCGLSPWRTPYQVWQDKLNLAGPQEENEAMAWGSILEPLVRQRYSDVTGRSVRLPVGILKHPGFAFMMGNIDGFTDDGKLIEIKTARIAKDWGEPGTDEIPVHYIFQVQHYLSITGLEIADIPVLFGGQEFQIYVVRADKEFQSMLIEKEAVFWELVQKKIPPEPVNYEDIVRQFATSRANSIIADAGVILALSQMRTVREEIKNLQESEERWKTDILKYLQDNDTLIDAGGITLATWKTDKSAKPKQKVKEALKILQKEHPDIYSKYWEEGKPARRFLLKELEGEK